VFALPDCGGKSSSLAAGGLGVAQLASIAAASPIALTLVGSAAVIRRRAHHTRANASPESFRNRDPGGSLSHSYQRRGWSFVFPFKDPLTLVRHYVRTLKVEYLLGQTYLDPHPKELMLRNHV